ncbi:CheR family methyltransferase [Roseiconus lacunae]|uniref:CheR family methyltransferase n=1 Tax=Roseiconus lacunae TaxID=2605694 RepID=UPI001E639459|nr:CheR family methyltransferase [Roseiconus lacunae]MCD0460985.1 methyltransferase domain-containing protein [Roseiconus lacunae]
MTTTDAPTQDAAQKAVLRVPQFRLFRDLIYKSTGISLGDNKQDFVQSRLRKRLRHLNIGSFAAYYDLIKSQGPDGPEMEQMINRITTNKTHFFREEHHFKHLCGNIFARMIQEADRGERPKKVRIWCAAASTGEEPYTLAIAVRDTFGHLPGWDVRILATDIDTSVLEKAKQATYIPEQLLETPPEYIKKYFSPAITEPGHLTVRPEVTQSVTFRQLNLLASEWPMRMQFDVIFCRNVLIYFDQQTQDKVMRHMAQYLKPEGALFIGHSESLSGLTDTYTRTGRTIYQHTSFVKSASQSPARPGSQSALAARPQSSLQAAPPARPAPPPPAPALQKKSIIVGDVLASDQPILISTVLGSCIAVCLYDEVIKAGGMNHFALPSGDLSSRKTTSFGVHAMELLINDIMHFGADRRRLKAKVFGGANVLGLSDDDNIGTKNEQFIREFLAMENIPIIAKFLGGNQGMQVLFEPCSGRAKMKLLDRKKTVETEKMERAQTTKKSSEPVSDITLF